jgi:hypothetical protein
MQGRRLAHTMSTHSMSRSGSRDRGDRDRDRDRERESQKRAPRSAPRGEGSREAHAPQDLMEVSVRPLSTYAMDALSEVAERFYNKKCEVSELLDSALGADPSNFKKVRGSQILQTSCFFACFRFPAHISLNLQVYLHFFYFHMP